MIKVIIYRNASDEYFGFQMEGHAEFAAYGNDIVCAAVSALVINTINSIEAFTEDVFQYARDEKRDILSFEVTSRPINDHTELLFRSLVLGLTSIAREYGDKYIELRMKKKQEV